MPIDAVQAAEPDNSREAWAAAVNDEETPVVAVAEETPAVADAEPADAPEVAGQTEGDAAEVADLEPPEFWSKERKALWAKADPELRQAILDHDKEARSSANKRIEEAADLRKKAEALSAAAIKDRDDLAQWWQQTGPRLAKQFQDKWAGINWAELAESDPARYTVLKQQREDEAGTLGETIRRHEAEVEQSNKRAAAAHQDVRRSEHEKLATELPTYFGKPDVAQKTYDDLSTYLVEQGVPKDRIPNIYEAAVVKIALKAMRFDKAQAAAKKVSQPGAAPAKPGVEVKPGPKANSGPASTAEREALAKLRNGGKLSREEGSLAFA